MKVCATDPRCLCGGDACACVEGYPYGKCARCGASLRDPAKPAPSAMTMAWVEYLNSKPKT